MQLEVRGLSSFLLDDAQQNTLVRPCEPACILHGTRSLTSQPATVVALSAVCV